MRILAIRGCNLNSLAEAFDIDFTAEPLRSAGLFAITGDTGAGKSTILDALCLALYGECPRLRSGEGREAVMDAGGELQASDARSCLRKGTATGYAEVDYLGNDGARYQAKWVVRRARNKPDGRLQQAERTLTNLQTGLVEASNDTLMRDRVPLTTGLTYEEFKRTVLLAQGEFDALLRATPAMRAELLEKITGTEIYREISRRAFERCAAEEGAVKTLQDRRNEHQVMSVDERAAKQQQCAALIEDDGASADAISRLAQFIERHDAVKTATESLASAQQRLTEATTAKNGAAQDRDLLNRLDRAEPLRAPLSQAQKCAEALRSAEFELETERALHIKAEGIRRAKAELRDAAITALAAIDQQVEKFTPEWDRAIALDSAVAEAQAEVGKADELAAAAEAACERADAELAEASNEFDRAAVLLIAARDKAATLAPMKPLGERWPEIEGKLEKQREFVAERHERRTEATTQSEVVEALDAGLQDAADLYSADLKQREGLDAQLEELRGAHRAMDQASLETRHARMGQLAEHVRALARACADGRQAEQDMAAARTSASAAQHALEVASGLADQRRREIATANAVLMSLVDPLEQAQTASSDEAERLRLRLRPGEPCPVCGSCEHPMHADAALAAIAASLQEKVDATRAELANAQTTLLDAQGAMAAESERLKQAGAAQDRARQILTRAGEDYARALQPAQAAWADHQLPGALPETVSAFEETTVELVEIEREHCASLLAKARDLRVRMDGLAKEREDVSKKMERRAAACEADRAKLTQARSAMLLAEQAEQTLTDRIQSSNRELEVWIAPAGVGPDDLDHDLAGCIVKLKCVSQAWRGAIAALETAEQATRGLEPAVADAKNNLTNASVTAAAARQAAATRLSELAAKQKARAAVLDGEPTDAHKSRILAARATASKAHDEANRTASEAMTALATALASFNAAERRRNELSTALSEADALLSSKLEAADVAREHAALLLATSEDEVKKLREQLQKIDTEVISAEAALAERSRDLDAALAAGVPDAPRDAIIVQRDALIAQQLERKEQIGALRNELSQDYNKQAQVAEIDRQIALAAQSAKVWKQVSQAIGSHDGAKFSRFAQSITLDLLLELANQRLADLNPRYGLVKAGELGFQIVDNEFGEELRATRSLSGGERFLVSLAMALALSGIGGRQTFADTLFIDEGFGSLDSDTLDVAIAALETLQSQGRNVGVISHVEAMKERIPIQIRVSKQGGGRSAVSIVGYEGVS